ncbi:ABC transporter ATP-binding protein [Herbaspirillum huttiense F1]|jgi:ABC-type nitrate/sulfonate/bicarbonate transport system, ATPase component|uniref:ABC transporter ATP-binding protein n=1 Tax=Herbaspirillum TaxID=963 RepID=UPI000EB14CF6|nr:MULTISPECIES: ABC transporter ATP-binding protein [Herbaspirillum]MBP1315832.1 NitT/TauT family transport system ATP-binding protein [Herbaspirillum sp. 1130]MCO4858177.1 ABC transporter ATP-binding protein [Herbaspirillum sp. WGmk3]MDR6740607.1 NitT/TauT family transport system ATP-binding protein [Herbaspirillum sp. 1173]MDT0356828.1 ABC transporter ATP-binding protein [Herbaspirillum huttiense F1]
MIEIEFRKVGKSFVDRQTAQARAAVTNVNLSIRSGEVVSIIGPSGCGKSTLLNMGAGLYLPSEGEVFVGGEKVIKPVRKVAFMLQKDLLMPWRNIRANVTLGLEIDGMREAERRRIADELLAKCHLRGFEEHYPYQLSGGMRQRAALARTLAVDPQVLLLDEPFSALDAQTKMVLQQDLAKMLYEKKKTALFITHDLVEAIALSDRLLVMSERPGTIVEEIEVNLPFRDNPLERRKLPEIGPLQGRLMELLKVGKETAELH